MKNKLFNKPVQKTIEKQKSKSKPENKKIFSSEGLNFDFKKDLPQVDTSKSMKPFEDKKSDKNKKSAPIFDPTKKLNIVPSRTESSVPKPLKNKKKD